MDIVNVMGCTHAHRFIALKLFGIFIVRNQNSIIPIPYSGKFSCEVQNFVFFEGRQKTRKLKMGKTPTHWYFTCKAIGGCGYLALNVNIRTQEHFLLRALEPNSENSVAKLKHPPNIKLE